MITGTVSIVLGAIIALADYFLGQTEIVKPNSLVALIISAVETIIKALLGKK
jgi:hypothetical protein